MSMSPNAGLDLKDLCWLCPADGRISGYQCVMLRRNSTSHVGSLSRPGPVSEIFKSAGCMVQGLGPENQGVAVSGVVGAQRSTGSPTFAKEVLNHHLTVRCFVLGRSAFNTPDLERFRPLCGPHGPTALRMAAARHQMRCPSRWASG